MKKNSLLLGTLTLALFAGLAWFSFGCGKPKPMPPSGTSPVSAVRTSFSDVTAQLDPGGNFYLYLGTAQWLEHLATTVETWRKGVAALPNLSPENAANINHGFDLVNHLIKDSGIQDITGLGLSSVEIEPGVFRNKMLLHHYAGNGDGFLWKLCGQDPHPLAGLNLLPANTALAAFSDVDVPLLWKVAQDEVAQSGFPPAQDFIAKLPDQFEQKTKLKWKTVLNSLGGEAGFVLTLNEAKTIPVPLPGGALTIPEPGLLLVLEVNDDTIFNRIDEELKANPQVIRVDESGLKMRTMPVPLPFIGTLRPTTASSGGYLFIATSDELVKTALAVQSGKTPGLKSTDEFKHLSENLPTQGNNFTFMSERFGRVLFQIQQQAMAGQAKQSGAAQAKWMQSLLHSQSAFAYSVGINTPQGCLTVGNSSQSLANLALLPALVVPAMAAAVAIPNFVRARSVSQENACINNLRQLDAAKNEWALEKGQPAGAVPTKQDLLPYLRRWPACPQGGTYTLGPVGDAPTCSIPGHKLP